MKTVFLSLSVAVFVALSPWIYGADAKDQQNSEVERILDLHKEAIQAHMDGDVDKLLARESDEIVRVNWGEVMFPPKDDRVRQFKQYLENTVFEEYQDLIDPIIRVSEDGTLGWLIAQVKIVGTRTNSKGEQAKIDSVWAWIELYEKKNGRWFRVGDVSNVRPREESQ